ncbi:hypothetical protein [Selenomonas ruminis]|uniref:Chemotaxis protein CheX n=1 Tax=Selenomonas ruminis TaxID=2593411 RepID=A0A5D6W5Y1_9FIRM|nr:hypothetical protein [Selenomonas sp. mPRGC5]TYZ23861.1 hypothetical protein FZ040_03795 [Selenomonas sp. mPRGC5]
MKNKYNIAQCLLNERNYSPEEIQSLLRQGETDEEILVHRVPEIVRADARPIRTAVKLAAADGYDDELNIYTKYVELFIEKMQELTHTFSVVSQDLVVTEEPSPAYAVSIRVSGDIDFVGGVIASEPVFLEMARRYSGEEFDRVDDLAIDCCEEFLNVVQGLFSIEMAKRDLEGDLHPPRWKKDVVPQGSRQLRLRVYTSFGSFQIILAVDEFF